VSSCKSSGAPLAFTRIVVGKRNHAAVIDDFVGIGEAARRS
jgi:hypothetical protein